MSKVSEMKQQYNRRIIKSEIQLSKNTSKTDTDNYFQGQIGARKRENIYKIKNTKRLLNKRLENVEMIACYYGNEPETLGKHDFLARQILSKLAQEKVKNKIKKQ